MSYTQLLAERKKSKAEITLDGAFVRSNAHTVVTGFELLSRPQIDLPMLVDGLMPQTGISILSGASDLGKSAWLRQMAVNLVTHEERFCGFKLNPKHKDAIFLASEDDENATSAILKKQVRKKEGMENLRFIFSPENAEAAIKAELERKKSDLVVVDCLLDFFGSKNLNQANEVRDFLNPFKKLASEFETQICFLHHTSKRSDEREPNKANLLGSGALEHAPRLVLELRAGETPDTRYLCILKANFLPPSEKSEAHELRFEDLRFVSTGNRKPLHEVVKRSNERSREHLIEKAKELSATGKSQRDIAKQLDISLGAVNGYLKGVHVQTPREMNMNTTDKPPF